MRQYNISGWGKMRQERANQQRSWKMERASVHRRHRGRAISNKYSPGDTDKKPRPHVRKGLWVGGYRRRDGVKVKGYYRTNRQYRWRK